jgi:GTP pyrophosphokinase
MVQVRQQTLIDAQGAIDLNQWLEQLPLVLESDDRIRLQLACELVQHAQQLPAADAGDWARESNCLIAGLDMTIILADLHVDLDCLLAGVLYRAVREGRLNPEQVRTQFGDGVIDLIDGVLRMAAIGDLPLQTESPVLGQAHGQKDNIRKMLIALVDDVRVALIKLAERTCAIRSVKEYEERRRHIGQ